MEQFLPDEKEEVPLPTGTVIQSLGVGAALGVPPTVEPMHDILLPRIYVAGKAPVQQAMIDVLGALGYEGAIAVPREISAKMGVSGALKIGG